MCLRERGVKIVHLESYDFNFCIDSAMKLGLPLVPVYANQSIQGAKLLQGVNFASGASRIMGYTGIEFVRFLCLIFSLQFIK